MLFVLPIDCYEGTCNFLAENLNYFRFNNCVKFDLDFGIFEVAEFSFVIGLLLIIDCIHVIFFIDVRLLAFSLLAVKILDFVLVSADTLERSLIVWVIIVSSNDWLFTRFIALCSLRQSH